MLRKLLPVLLVLVGCGAGAAAGVFLRPSAPPAEGAATDAPDDHAENGGQGADEGQGAGPLHEYVKLNNQFVVPVMADGRVSSLVVLSLSLEVTPGQVERVYEMEPKLRDAMLQVLFDHANSGGFNGSFTDGANLVLLREALLETALRVFGKDVTDVLIVEIVRQDN
ncbi:MAG: flagellar basal body-associated FliL family protein [Rhodobacter sp.]|nr:flagellar basal body-associated FliL family protein [Rhodobacter sp.]MCA3514660.1 flagellar basal body-associated FliL family protein [Rhodobacter sp.]MCA3518968.1 flagellar basal body-associated FliL family protein [Rhodobacter sp.]MCA3522720.1 flagellar basal body-associated FliL family protein [Rhodobacter sp.]MCA3524651.1 flagellar basal body-associated FliL family protein [Rhodobacter sp.]